MSRKGACLCGEVELELPSEASPSVICYCQHCRKNSGHIGQIIARYATEAVKINDSHNQLTYFEVGSTASGHPKRKYFCKNCGCTIMTMPMKHNGDIVFVRPTLLETVTPDLIPAKAIFEASLPKGMEATKMVLQ